MAYQLNGQRTYALEGAIFIAGAAVQMLRDGLKIVRTADETVSWPGAPIRAAGLSRAAFVGLGAPYWNAEARGPIFGLTGERRGLSWPRPRSRPSATRP